jgi:hypothetical protein
MAEHMLGHADNVPAAGPLSVEQFLSQLVV